MLINRRLWVVTKSSYRRSLAWQSKTTLLGYCFSSVFNTFVYQFELLDEVVTFELIRFA